MERVGGHVAGPDARSGPDGEARQCLFWNWVFRAWRELDVSLWTHHRGFDSGKGEGMELAAVCKSAAALYAKRTISVDGDAVGAGVLPDERPVTTAAGGRHGQTSSQWQVSAGAQDARSIGERGESEAKLKASNGGVTWQ